MKKRVMGYRVALAVVVAIGFFLRLSGVEREPLWFDELSTWEFSRTDVAITKSGSNLYGFVASPVPAQPQDIAGQIGLIARNTEADRIHLPLYYVLVHFLIRILGPNEMALRLPSVVFGSGSIILVFFLARKLAGTRTALIAAVIMSFSWFPIHYSREARMYALVLFFSLLSVLSLLNHYRAQAGKAIRRRSWLASATVSAAILANLHFFGTYLAALVWIYYSYIVMTDAAGGRTRRCGAVEYATGTLLWFSGSLPAIIRAVGIFFESGSVPTAQWVPVPGLSDFFLWFNSFFGYPADNKLVYVKPDFYSTPLVRDVILALLIVSFVRWAARILLAHRARPEKRLPHDPRFTGTILCSFVLPPYRWSGMASFPDSPYLSR